MTPDELLGTPSWPWALPDEQTLTYASTMAATITNGKTIISTTITGAATLNLDLTQAPDLRDGSVLILLIHNSDSSNHNVTLSTGFVGSAAVFSATASKTLTQSFELIKGAFTPIAAPFQITT